MHEATARIGKYKWRIILITYAAMVLYTFGHAGANYPYIDKDGYDGVATMGRSLFMSMVWPFYWSYRIQAIF